MHTQSLTNAVMGSLHSVIQLSGHESCYSPTPSFEIKNALKYTPTEADLVIVRSKAWVCGSSLAGVVGSNPADNIDVSLF